jgi:hypothetical protein
MQANDNSCRGKRNNGIWVELHPEVTEIQAENPAILAKREGKNGGRSWTTKFSSPK